MVVDPLPVDTRNILPQITEGRAPTTPVFIAVLMGSSAPLKTFFEGKQI
jgi:hypothetical protein